MEYFQKIWIWPAVCKIFLYGSTVLIIMTFNFFLIRFMPGDPVEYLVGEEDYRYLKDSHPEVIEEIEVSYGLDESIGRQYLTYLKKVISGDMGQSFKNKTSVSALVMKRLGFTLRLVFPAVVLAAILGIFIGGCAGYFSGSIADKLISQISLMVYSVPGYCMGILLLMIFCFYLGWLPSGGISSGSLHGWAYWMDLFWHMVLPVTGLTLGKLSYNILMMRSSMADIWEETYMLTAKSKGLDGKRLFFVHMLPNAAVPMITMVMMQMGFIVSGSLMIETIFNWDGMGLLIYNAVLTKDYPVLQGSLLVLTLCVIFSNIISDVLCMLLDPRIKEGMGNDEI